MRYANFFYLLMAVVMVSAGCSNMEEQCRYSVSKEEIRSVIEFLGHDLLEGRAPGTRGGELAEIYVKSCMQQAGLEPYKGSYFHPLEIKGFTLTGLDARAGGRVLRFPDDIVGSMPREQEDFFIEGDAVFCGYGIKSDAWEWDDYKDIDVRGKIVVVRVNEPGRSNRDLFDGEALTYFGRWTYKIEEAARRGAKGILLLHTDATAGYQWHVVKNSWGGEELYLPEMLDNDLEFRGWIREEPFRQILEEKGCSLDRLNMMSESREFEPVLLPIRVQVQGTSSWRSFMTRNVAGCIKGRGGTLQEKAVILSAHIDHLGMNQRLEGDTVFNGAIDNASAVAAMLCTAKLLKDHENMLHYPVIVLACQAEEAGLLGSRHFASALDPSACLANINFESTPVWEKTMDLMAVGAKYSDLETVAAETAESMGLEYSEFSMSNQGFFYRSDQFSFARYGIPAVWISAGEKFTGGVNRMREFFLGDYHTVDDEYNPSWKLESTAQTIEAAVRMTEALNKRKAPVEWTGKMTFPVER